MTDQPAGGSLAERAARLEGALNRALVAFHDLNMCKDELAIAEGELRTFMLNVPAVFTSPTAFLVCEEAQARWREVAEAVRGKKNKAVDCYDVLLKVLRDLLPLGVCVKVSGYKVHLYEGMSGLGMTVELEKKGGAE